MKEWRVVAERVTAGEMPPKKETAQPSPQEVSSAMAAINAELSRAAVALKDQIGSDGTFRRLNRTQYQNTLNDLFGKHTDLASMLPRDATGAFGLDRIGSALHMSGEQIQGIAFGLSHGLGTESRGVPRVDTPYRLPVRIGSERCNPEPSLLDKEGFVGTITP
ncbi:MAG: DUF1587 domain-containing protein [Planctomycetota bacterium]